MALIACPVREKQKSHDLCNAFIAGAPKDAEGYVFAGVKHSNWHEWLQAKASVQYHRAPFYYIDNSYFDATRVTHFRVTKNRFQVEALAHSYTKERFDALGLEIKPMCELDLRLPNLCVMQSALHMDLVGEPDWWDQFGNIRDGSCIVRHWIADKRKQQATLMDDIDMCRQVVTHSSAAAVTALLAGVRTLVSKVSSVYGCEISRDGLVDKRHHIMCVLADNQFTITEMKEGLAWQTVK